MAERRICRVCGPLGETEDGAEHVTSQSHRTMILLARSMDWRGRQVINNWNQGNRIEEDPHG
jgi:hypothetical protein